MLFFTKTVSMRFMKRNIFVVIYSCLFINLWAFSFCKEDIPLISVEGNIALTKLDNYFLYGYYAKEKNPNIDFLWQCHNQKILGFHVIKSRSSVSEMLKKGFEIAPIDLTESDFEDIWEERIKLPMESLSTLSKKTYNYKLLYGQVDDFRRHNRSYWIDLQLQNQIELSLYIPVGYFSLFNFRQKNFKRGDFIYVLGLIEYWKKGFTIQIIHPNQMIVVKEEKVQRAITMRKD